MLNDTEKLALEYAFKGLDEKSVIKMLIANKCSKEIATQTSYIIFRDYITKNHHLSRNPTSFGDISDFLNKSLINNNISLFEYYFNKYQQPRANIIETIKSDKEQVKKQLFPLVSNLIFENNIIAKTLKELPELEEKELYELRLFGVWPLRMLYRMNRAVKIDHRLIKMMKLDEIENIAY